MSSKTSAFLWLIAGIIVAIAAYKVWYSSKVGTVLLALLAYFLLYKSYKGFKGK